MEQVEVFYDVERGCLIYRNLVTGEVIKVEFLSKEEAKEPKLPFDLENN